MCKYSTPSRIFLNSRQLLLSGMEPLSLMYSSRSPCPAISITMYTWKSINVTGQEPRSQNVEISDNIIPYYATERAKALNQKMKNANNQLNCKSCHFTWKVFNDPNRRLSNLVPSRQSQHRHAGSLTDTFINGHRTESTSNTNSYKFDVFLPKTF